MVTNLTSFSMITKMSGVNEIPRPKELPSWLLHNKITRNLNYTATNVARRVMPSIPVPLVTET